MESIFEEMHSTDVALVLIYFICTFVNLSALILQVNLQLSLFSLCFIFNSHHFYYLRELSSDRLQCPFPNMFFSLSSFIHITQNKQKQMNPRFLICSQHLTIYNDKKKESDYPINYATLFSFLDLLPSLIHLL